MSRSKTDLVSCIAEGGKVEELGIRLGPGGGFDGSANLVVENALGAGAPPNTGPPKTLLDAPPNELVPAPPKLDGVDGEATSFPNTDAPASLAGLLAGMPKDDDTRQ